MSKCVSVPIVAGVCETEERVFEAAFLGREPCEFDSEANREPEDLDGLESKLRAAIDAIRSTTA